MIECAVVVLGILAMFLILCWRWRKIVYGVTYQATIAYKKAKDDYPLFKDYDYDNEEGKETGCKEGKVHDDKAADGKQE